MGVPALAASLGLILVGGLLGVGLLRRGARRSLAGQELAERLAALSFFISDVHREPRSTFINYRVVDGYKISQLVRLTLLGLIIALAISGCGLLLSLKAATSAVDMAYHGGPTLTHAEVSVVFLGQPEVKPITRYVRWLVNSTYMDSLVEYRVGRGTFGHVTVVPGHLAATITEADVRGYMPPAPRMLRLIFLPPGVEVVGHGGESGYHNFVPGFGGYAVMTDVNFTAVTSTTSHELAEAVTSLIPTQGWANGSLGEIGDPCAGVNRTLDGYIVQKLWLNSAKGCT